MLAGPNGTRSHLRPGYVYTAAMTGRLFTAFMIYHLRGRFGLFHWLAVVSSLRLAARRKRRWQQFNPTTGPPADLQKIR